MIDCKRSRGEGNELGYDHNPSSAKTTIYEATSISTTPSTTSTSTTQRPTTALFTEAMIPSRYTPRYYKRCSIRERDHPGLNHPNSSTITLLSILLNSFSNVYTLTAFKLIN